MRALSCDVGSRRELNAVNAYSEKIEFLDDIPREAALGGIEVNTETRSPLLCPEIRIRVLKPDGPMAAAWGSSLFCYGGPRPYWAYCWASGQALARYLLDSPGIARGRRVIDLGTGCGIVAIAAALAGAAEVLAVDRDPLARLAAELNASFNGVNLTVAQLEAGDVKAWQPDLVVAADICYAPEGAQLLVDIHEAGLRVLAADPGRPDLPRNRLEPLAEYVVRTFPEIEAPELVSAFVYRFSAGGKI